MKQSFDQARLWLPPEKLANDEQEHKNTKKKKKEEEEAGCWMLERTVGGAERWGFLFLAARLVIRPFVRLFVRRSSCLDDERKWRPIFQT